MKLVNWAVAFATRLLVARAQATGELTGEPVNAAMWPPHRPRPTLEVRRKQAKDRVVMSGGSRVHFTPVVKLQGGKGLRP